MASDDGEAGVLQHAAQLALAVDAQIVMRGRPSPLPSSRRWVSRITPRARSNRRSNRSTPPDASGRSSCSLNRTPISSRWRVSITSRPPGASTRRNSRSAARSPSSPQVAKRGAQAQHGIEGPTARTAASRTSRARSAATERRARHAAPRRAAARAVERDHPVAGACERQGVAAVVRTRRRGSAPRAGNRPAALRRAPAPLIPRAASRRPRCAGTGDRRRKALPAASSLRNLSACQRTPSRVPCHPRRGAKLPG